MSEQIVVNLTRALSSTNVAKRGGGTYPGAEIVYSMNGNSYVKGIHEKALEKHPELATKIKALENKTNIPIVLVREKVGDYINIIDVREAQPGEQSSPMSESSPSTNQFQFEAFSTRVKDLEDRVATLEAHTSSEVPY